jgi:hypothetical protein
MEGYGVALGQSDTQVKEQRSLDDEHMNGLVTVPTRFYPEFWSASPS